MFMLTKGRTWHAPHNNLSSLTRRCLGKEPLKINSESDEDNIICERCSHVLAKCFFRTKKEDDYKPQEAEEPRLVPRSIENSRSEPRSAPQVHNRGIEVDKNKAKAILQAKPPSNKKELQRLLGQINFLRRFIANVARKTKVFYHLLRLKDHEAFVWHEEHQKAFDAIKQYLTTPPVLIPPREGKPLKLYIFCYSRVDWKPFGPR
jgi:hypothetical protein